MTEYRYVLMDVRVTKPKVNQHDQAAASLLEVELKKVKEREKKLEAALYEVFPLDLYTQARPDVKEAYHGERSQIIEHFIRAGINEIDLNGESNKNKLELSQHVKEAAILLAVKLDKTRAALLKVFPLNRYAIARPDVEASCGGKPDKMVEHFIEYGMHEIDIRHKFLTLKTSETCLKNISSPNFWKKV